MSEPVVINLIDSDCDAEAWNEGYWIRPLEPRIYPASDVPQTVLNRRLVLLSLPPEADILLPLGILPITTLLNEWTDFPTPRQDVLVAKVYFSNDACDSNSHAIVKALKRRPTFPPLKVVLNLEKRFGQAWFDGKQSIQDSFYTGYPLPLWVLTLWRNFDHVFRTRAKWTAAEEIVRSCSVSTTVCADVGAYNNVLVYV
jgi:hypothetical protein